ncbi:gamma-aminobutyric acid type B receptor subunit 1-like [Paramuricea clavata]|uniref:Gamma-aminobutyric acid type B receptor subunit 2 n=2 Tax=Paramuricea clavata TaxID=317549 RepID=A0A6S7GW26_PARCT|nr:gamma-aminobutyric acid type B receptor subunit 1-like [Paramuricea clavata]
MVEHITESPPKIAFLGPGCSIAAAPVAETLPFWNVTQISFSLTSPDLSNKKKYPNIYRINPSETIHDPALLALTNFFKWERLFIIKHELRIFSSITESLHALLVEKKKSVDVIGFLNNPTSAIKSLKDKDARIVVLLMYENQARKIVCSAYQNGFYGSHIVWILRGWYSKKWWTVNDTQCTIEEIKKVITNVFYVDHVDYASDDAEVFGLTKSRFNEKYTELIRKKNSTIFKVNKYAPYGYDAVVMLARALNSTEESLRRMNKSLSDFTYARSDIAEVIKDNISNTDNIKGLTGVIKLDEQGDRIINVWLQQLQDYEVVDVALYCTENGSIELMPSKNFLWTDGRVPLDRRAKNDILLCISRPIFWWTTSASICGVFASFYFLWINIKQGSQRFFKMSTPPLNNLMIIGAIIAYIYVPLHGIKSCTMEVTVLNSILCKVDAFFISIAFSLVFGAIFMKTWRIYKIFTNVKLSKQLRFLTNKHLVVLVILLVIFDSIYLLIWNTVHPLQDRIEEVLVENHHAVNKVYFAHACTSPYYHQWFVGLVSYKGILMLFGMFLTWETRNVSFPGLNDSKYIGMCVYNIFIVTMVVLPVGMFTFKANVDAGYSITATSIIFCTTATLVLMFYTKIHLEKKTATTPTHPTMSVDKSVIGPTIARNAIGPSPTWKHCYP